MNKALYQSRIISSFLEKRRKRRLDAMLDKVHTFSGMTILDVGCGTDGRSVHQWIDPSYHITGIDLYDPSKVHIDHPRFTYKQQDARDMSCFADQSFDLAISVGMMEHIGHFPDLNKMAQEIHRIAKEYIIVVPYRYALVEPHFKFPIFQLLPTEMQLSLVYKFNLHNLKQKLTTDPLYIKKHFLWLTAEQWRHVWPESQVSVFNMENYMIVKCKK